MNHEEGPMIAPESPDPEATATEGAAAPEENDDAAEGITRDTRLAGGLDQAGGEAGTTAGGGAATPAADCAGDHQPPPSSSLSHLEDDHVSDISGSDDGHDGTGAGRGTLPPATAPRPRNFTIRTVLAAGPAAAASSEHGSLRSHRKYVDRILAGVTSGS